MNTKTKKNYSIIYFLLAALHIIYLGIFIYSHSTIMVVFNVFCILVFGILGVTAVQAKNLIAHFLICFIQLLANVVVSSLLCGLVCGYSIILLAILPLIFYSVHMVYRSGKNDNKTALIDCGIVAVVYYATWLCDFVGIGRKYYLGNTLEHVLYFINLTGTLIILLGFLLVFVSKVNVERKAHEQEKEEIETSANLDPLTKLLNRRSLDQYFDNTIKKFGAYGNDFSILMCDIDNFKHVNDTYGHDCGDEVLKNIAGIIQNVIRSDDVAFRWGGEEMLVIINAKGYIAKNVAERCRKTVENSSVIYKEQEIKVTITIGGASYYQGATKDDLIKKADDNLYYGKNHGKNQVVM